MSDNQDKNKNPKKTPPLTPNERARLAYKRKTQDNTYLKVMLLKETKLKLNELVADSGGTQNDFLEQLINDVYSSTILKK
jgi:hypothetical protein